MSTFNIIQRKPYFYMNFHNHVDQGHKRDRVGQYPPRLKYWMPVHCYTIKDEQVFWNNQ